MPGAAPSATLPERLGQHALWATCILVLGFLILPIVIIGAAVLQLRQFPDLPAARAVAALV
jgi:hypothetical protein